MQLKVTVAFVLGVTLLVIAPIVHADPIRGPSETRLDQPHIITLMVVTIGDVTHSQKRENVGDSPNGPQRVPVHLASEDSDSAPSVAIDGGSTDSPVWNERNTGNSPGSRVWSQINTRSEESAMWHDSHEGIVTGNLNPAPESSAIIPLGLLVACLLLFRKRLVGNS